MIDLSDFNKEMKREYRIDWLKRNAWWILLTIAAYTYAIGYAFQAW